MPSLPFCLTLALAVLLAGTTQGLATSTKGENSIAINNEQEAEAGQSGAQPMGKMTESSGAAPIEGNVTTMEYSALVDLYSSTNGNGWINNSNWLNPYLSPCNWYGIICDATFRHVLLLDLSSNKLSGSVSNSLSGLFNLQVLRLQNNAIGGVLPDSLSQLKSLDVANFSVNSFVGPLPDSYGVLTNYSLLYLGAAFNSLSGSIPQWVQSAKGIVTIDLRGNPFFCPIPSWASYTGASCFNVNITNIEPSCPQPNGLVLVFGGPFPSSLNNIFCQWTSLWFGTVWYSPAEAVNQQTVACGYGLIQPGTPVSLQLTQYNQPVTSQPFYPSLDCYPNSTTNRRIRRLQPSSDSSLLTAPASLLLSLLSLALFFI